MDRNSITGLVLIAGILITFSLFMNKAEEKPDKKKEAQKENIEKNLESNDSLTKTNVAQQDSVLLMNEAREKATLIANKILDSSATDSARLAVIDSISPELYSSEKKVREKEMLNSKFGVFAKASQGKDENFALENDQIKIMFSSKGGDMSRVELKKYMSYKAYAAGKTPKENPLVLLERAHKMDYLINDQNSQNDVHTSDLYFTKEGGSNDQLTLITTGANGALIRYTYKLKGYELSVEMEAANFPSGVVFEEFVWHARALHNEKSRTLENQMAGIFYKYPNEGRTYMTETASYNEKMESKIEWIAFKQPYFSAVLINEGAFGKGGMMSQTTPKDQSKYIKWYTATFENPMLASGEKVKFKMYLGPNQYDELVSYNNDMERIINHGWGIFGWLNRSVFMPLYKWIAGFGLNHGLVILLMTIIVRIIITPLIFRNYKSSAKMRVLKPEIDELAKKFPDPKDAMAKQQAQMKLYRSTGVNPLAGCIPMLIQMPILFAMFRLIPSLFDIRQSPFLWADDLSAYDSILDLGFNIPLYGDHVSLFTLLMAGSTLAYTIMSSSQMTQQQPGMPNMKIIMYIFPIMMIFFFNSYSSGLSFYYFLSSLFSILIMWGIKKYFIDENKLRAQIETNKQKPRKKSRFQQRLEEIQRQQNAKRGK